MLSVANAPLLTTVLFPTGDCKCYKRCKYVEYK
nr:MAG TPA: hypothetical protein [Crassvirales sp.]